jgi:hypothetical protein
MMAELNMTGNVEMMKEDVRMIVLQRNPKRFEVLMVTVKVSLQNEENYEHLS